MHLDSRTLVVVATFGALVPSAIAALLWHTRRTCPGFGHWTLANILSTLALILFSIRGMAPDWSSIVLANALVVGASILYFQGIRLFRGLRLHRWPEYLVGVLAISGVTYFTYFSNNIDVRILVMSIPMGSFGLASGIMLVRDAPAGRRLSRLFTGVIFALAGAANLIRGFYVYTFTPVTDLFGPSALNAAFFGSGALCVIGWSFGFILMTDEQLALEPAEALPEPAAVPAESGGREYADDAVPESEVRQQVLRIIASAIFRRSARMERFLTLAVERALSGHPEELKEYALGRDVFNRGEDYDPRLDSIVRVEAQRLRRKLREYYDSSGRDDAVIVEFRTGSYVPSFRYRKPSDKQLTFSADRR